MDFFGTMRLGAVVARSALLTNDCLSCQPWAVGKRLSPSRLRLGAVGARLVRCETEHRKKVQCLDLNFAMADFQPVAVWAVQDFASCPPPLKLLQLRLLPRL